MEAALYQDIFANVRTAITIWRLAEPDRGESLTLIAANAAASALAGIDLRARVGRAIRECLPSVDPARIESYAEVVRSRRRNHLGEVFYRRDDSPPGVWGVITAFPIGEACIAISFEDITALKELQARSRRNELFLDSVVENIPDMVFIKEADELRFARVNRAAERLLGQAREDLVGKTDHDFFPASEADFFVQMDREVLRQLEARDIPEEPIHTADGVRFLHTKKVPIVDASGEPRYLLGVSEDITERKRLDDALRREIARTRLLQVIATEANEASSVDTAMQFAIDEVCSYLGWPVGHVYFVSTDLSGELAPSKIWNMDPPQGRF